MKSVIFPVAALLLLTAGIVVHWREYVPLLPDRVASHIDASGKANQWTDKASFLNGALLFLTICPLAVLSLAGLICVAIINLPAAVVNVPRKDYWLSSPERRVQATLVVLQFMLWFLFGLLAMVYFGAIHGMIMATLHPERDYNTENLAIFGLGLLFTVAQVAMLLYRLYHPLR